MIDHHSTHIKQEYVPQPKFVVLPRVGGTASRKRRFESRNNKTMKVVLPVTNQNRATQWANGNVTPTQVKKEFLGSTKAPENSFTALCNTILTQIYENSGKQNPKNSDFDVIYHPKSS